MKKKTGPVASTAKKRLGRRSVADNLLGTASLHDISQLKTVNDWGKFITSAVVMGVARKHALGMFSAKSLILHVLGAYAFHLFNQASAQGKSGEVPVAPVSNDQGPPVPVAKPILKPVTGSTAAIRNQQHFQNERARKNYMDSVVEQKRYKESQDQKKPKSILDVKPFGDKHDYQTTLKNAENYVKEQEYKRNGDYIAPHGDKKEEFARFVTGNKPIAHFDLDDDSHNGLDQLLKSGKYPHAKLEDGSYIIGQVGKDKEIKRLSDVLDNRVESDDYFREVGRAFGYDDKHIDKFIDRVERINSGGDADIDRPKPRKGKPKQESPKDEVPQNTNEAKTSTNASQPTPPKEEVKKQPTKAAGVDKVNEDKKLNDIIEKIKSGKELSPEEQQLRANNKDKVEEELKKAAGTKQKPEDQKDNPDKVRDYQKTIGGQIEDMFSQMGEGVHEAAKNKQMEYAKRISNGEKPEDVLQGIKPNGAMWNEVMKYVKKEPESAKPDHPVYDTVKTDKKKEEPKLTRYGRYGVHQDPSGAWVITKDNGKHDAFASEKEANDKANKLHSVDSASASQPNAGKKE